jgi:hypothetical protein
MPIDPNIAMSYKPVGLDIAGAQQAAEERKLMRSRNALAGTQQAAAQDELNNALAARRYAGGADLSDPQNAMRLLGYGKEGAEMYQSLLAGQASSASARKTRLEAAGVKAGQYRQALAFVNNPSAAAEWLQAHHDDPDMADSPVARMPLDVALSRIPQDPAGFQQWKQQAALGIDEYIKRNTLTAEQESMAADRAATRTETGRHNLATENIQSRQELRQGTPDPIKLRREATTLRKEFDALPEVKDFKAALPVLISARNAPDTAAGDIDLAYAVGKIYDPKSVVRESEQKLVYTTGSVLQKLLGGANVALTGGTRLQPEVRQKLLNALNNRVLQFRQAYDQSRSTYEGYANQSGFDPVNVIGKHPAEAYKGQSSSVAQVETDADYDKLPSGTLFVGPDGQQRRKP